MFSAYGSLTLTAVRMLPFLRLLPLLLVPVSLAFGLRKVNPSRDLSLV